MCKSSVLSEFTTITYLILCLAIPILYYIYYRNKGKKNKNYGVCFIRMVIIFLVLFAPKYIIKYFFKDECINCIINNVCKEDTMESDNLKTSTTTNKVSSTMDRITSTVSTSTTSKTTTNKKVTGDKVTYGMVKEIDGERKDVGISSKGYTIYTINGVTYVDGYMIVNKTYTVSSDFVPKDTYKPSEGKTNTCNDCINNTVYNAWKVMQADALSLGLNIRITSGYRPYQTQNSIYNRYVARDGKEKADTYSARPGSSEHQTGLCFDLNSISDAFANTAEGRWVNENAYKYGFIIRYPKNKNNETGYKYESWHLRYVGTDLSYKLYNNGDWITLESYFGLTSKYSE